jgi:hypothetical protein
MVWKQLAAVVLLFLVGHGAVALAQQPALPAPPPASTSPAAPDAEPQAGPASAWFAELSAFAVQPHSYLARSSGVSKELTPYLSWTVSPEVILGYQFAAGDAVLVSYRYIGTTGKVSDEISTTSTPLSTHWLDADYRSSTYELLPTLALRWQAGGRFAIVDRDGRFESPFEVARFDSTVLAGGAHVGTRLAWRPGQEGWSIFGSADIGVLAGGMHSTAQYHYTPLLDSLYPNSPPQDYSTGNRRAQWLLTPRLELGVSWESACLRWLSLEGGFRLDDFILYDDDSRIATIFHNLGPFCRCTLRY